METKVWQSIFNKIYKQGTFAVHEKRLNMKIV